MLYAQIQKYMPWWPAWAELWDLTEPTGWPVLRSSMQSISTTLT